MQKDSKHNHEEGSVNTAIVVGFVGIVGIIIVIMFFMWNINEIKKESFDQLHTAQETSAYRVAWVKDQLRKMEVKCSEKLTKLEGWIAFEKKYPMQAKLPIEFYTKGDCLMSEEMPEKQENK